VSSGNFKQNLFAQLARVGKGLGHGNRLELLELLAQRECNVDDLAVVAGLSVANTSQHLKQLRQAGLVTSRKEGQRVFYRINSEDVLKLLAALRSVAEHNLAETQQLIQNYLNHRDALEPVARHDLLARVRNGLVDVLDVRPPEEFSAGHVPGAINVPLKALESRLADLDPEHEIVAYCRGPHCILAFDAVARLRQEGFRAFRLEDGFPEWQHAGLPVETSPDQ
jgi:rhodanese-related sulfurtransferase/DNA-binding transcriptional ArsR family regulator